MKKIAYLINRVLKKIRGVASRNSIVDKTSKVEAGTTIIDSQMKKHSFCGYDCSINNCEIGSFVSIASNVSIGGAMHPMEYVSMSPVFLSHKDSVKTKFSLHHYKNIPKTIIGNDVWIGDGVYIKSGVTIGHGAVIGMGSVLTKDVPPYAVYAGNPAKLIKMRFNEDIIKSLLEIQWWNFSDSELRKVAGYFSDPHLFLNKVGKA